MPGLRRKHRHGIISRPSDGPERWISIAVRRCSTWSRHRRAKAGRWRGNGTTGGIRTLLDAISNFLEILAETTGRAAGGGKCEAESGHGQNSKADCFHGFPIVRPNPSRAQRQRMLKLPSVGSFFQAAKSHRVAPSPATLSPEPDCTRWLRSGAIPSQWRHYARIRGRDSAR